MIREWQTNNNIRKTSPSWLHRLPSRQVHTHCQCNPRRQVQPRTRECQSSLPLLALSLRVASLADSLSLAISPRISGWDERGLSCPFRRPSMDYKTLDRLQQNKVYSPTARGVWTVISLSQNALRWNHILRGRGAVASAPPAGIMERSAKGTPRTLQAQGQQHEADKERTGEVATKRWKRRIGKANRRSISRGGPG